MFKIAFNKGSNIPLLTDNIKQEDAAYTLRPVFFEELDLLGFNEHWTYPKAEAPLLWASGRRYFYRGYLVAEVFGGSMYSPPDLDIKHTGEPNPISIDELLDKNKDKLEILENEAKLFINETYKRRKKDTVITVSYSGGKDSQAVLELVEQVIPPDDFYIIFNDTGMEMPYISEAVNKLKRDASQKGRKLNIVVSEPPKEITRIWREFGPPTRTHRWCCTVCKTAPFVKAIKSIKKERSHILNFAGIRAEESEVRKGYERINKKGKHLNVSSIHPIFYWSSFEVYLYLMYRGIQLNKGYRSGLSRVGCSVCPFSSPISEFINHSLYPDKMDRFVEIIKASLNNNKIHVSDINEYINEKNWAKLIRSESMVAFDKKYSIQIQENDLIIITNIPISEVTFGLLIFEKFRIQKSVSVYLIEFIFGGRIINALVSPTEKQHRFMFKNIANNSTLVGLLKRIFNRLCYCVSCGSCEIECPTGALSMSQRTLDLRLCTNCLECITAHDFGCLNADHRINLQGESPMNSLGALNRYWGFGVRQEWLNSFIISPESWLAHNTLGDIQFKAMKNWLKDGEFLDNKLQPTDLLVLLREHTTQELATLILWINLCHNSSLCSWYAQLECREYTRADLESMLKEKHSSITDRSRNNALVSLLGTLKSTSLSDHYALCGFEFSGKTIKSIYKGKSKNVEAAALLYAVYRYAEKAGDYNCTLSQLMIRNESTAPFHELGLLESDVSKLLVSLQEHKSRLVRVEFNANLDNIFINKDYSPLDALRAYLGKS